MTETAVRADASEAIEVLTELGVEGVGQELSGLTVLGVTLSVDEPRRDGILHGVGDDVDDLETPKRKKHFLTKS